MYNHQLLIVAAKVGETKLMKCRVTKRAEERIRDYSARKGTSLETGEGEGIKECLWIII